MVAVWLRYPGCLFDHVIFRRYPYPIILPAGARLSGLVIRHLLILGGSPPPSFIRLLARSAPMFQILIAQTYDSSAHQHSPLLDLQHSRASQDIPEQAQHAFSSFSVFHFFQTVRNSPNPSYAESFKSMSSQ